MANVPYSSKLTFFILLLLGSCSKTNKESFSGQLFTLLPVSQTGVDFNNKIVESPTEHIYTFNYIYNGAGVAIADFDNYGFQD
ncbi:MAG: hypothetical protein WBB21_03340, partial [Saprospiraceae bacterium]